MESKTVGNLKLPVLGLGTWGIGGFMEMDSSNDDESIKAIKESIKMGYSHIDTAELYGAGHSEELVGEAIKDFKREEIIITSKVFKTNLEYDGVINACKRSLKRLKTNYIDIYLIHAPNPDVPIKETMKAMDFLLENNFIRHIGVSNFSIEQLKEAQSCTKNRIVVNQIAYNLHTRNIDKEGWENMESEIIPYCQENEIVIMAYRPLERTMLINEKSILDDLAIKYNKTKAQIAINWLISKRNIVTIPKSTNIEHLKENLGSIGWKMDEEDVILLDKTNF